MRLEPKALVLGLPRGERPDTPLTHLPPCESDAANHRVRRRVARWHPAVLFRSATQYGVSLESGVDGGPGKLRPRQKCFLVCGVIDATVWICYITIGFRVSVSPFSLWGAVRWQANCLIPPTLDESGERFPSLEMRLWRLFCMCPS